MVAFRSAKSPARRHRLASRTTRSPGLAPGPRGRHSLPAASGACLFSCTTRPRALLSLVQPVLQVVDHLVAVLLSQVADAGDAPLLQPPFLLLLTDPQRPEQPLDPLLLLRRDPLAAQRRLLRTGQRGRPGGLLLPRRRAGRLFPVVVLLGHHAGDREQSIPPAVGVGAAVALRVLTLHGQAEKLQLEELAASVHDQRGQGRPPVAVAGRLQDGEALRVEGGQDRLAHRGQTGVTVLEVGVDAVEGRRLDGGLGLDERGGQLVDLLALTHLSCSVLRLSGDYNLNRSKALRRTKAPGFPRPAGALPP